MTRPPSTPRLSNVELRALYIAVDELECYVSEIGDEDEGHQSQAYSVRVLKRLIERERRLRGLDAGGSRIARLEAT